jgi:hypothetical protein
MISMAIRFLLLPAGELRAHVGPVLMVEVTKLVAEHKDDGGAEVALESPLHTRVCRGIVRDPERFARPKPAARQLVRPLVFEHGEVVGHRIGAVARHAEPRIG